MWGANDVVMVCLWNMWQVNGWGQKIEIELLGLDFRCVVGTASIFENIGNHLKPS